MGVELGPLNQGKEQGRSLVDTAQSSDQRQERESQQFLHIPLSLLGMCKYSNIPYSVQNNLLHHYRQPKLRNFYTGNVQQPPHTRLLSCHIERQNTTERGSSNFVHRAQNTGICSQYISHFHRFQCRL
jgi:hypothetical protein